MRQIPRVSIAVALGVLACGGAEQAGYSDAVTADPDHYAVEFENDAVRVVRANYGPGESSVMHTHPAHCAVALNDATWRMKNPAGEVAELSTPMGEVVCVEEGAHLPENTTGTAGEVVIIEMKAAAPGTWTSTVPDAVTADPAHYSVEWENDAVRLVRANYGPGESSVLHHHPAYCSISLGDGAWRMTDAEGATTEDTSAHGQFGCVNHEAHVPENMGAEAGQAILIEFKGRENVE